VHLGAIDPHSIEHIFAQGGDRPRAVPVIAAEACARVVQIIIRISLLLDLSEVSVDKAQSQDLGFGHHPFERDVGQPIFWIAAADVGMNAREPHLLNARMVAGIALVPKDGVKGSALIVQ
jgi:hypothetical protein